MEYLNCSQFWLQSANPLRLRMDPKYGHISIFRDGNNGNMDAAIDNDAIDNDAQTF